MARIMIVDDAAFMRNMLKAILVEQGHEIIAEASTGKEAIQSYKVLKPDLVTMDITMPDMDGIEALKEIRHFDPKAKVIMCSAMGNRAMVMDSVKSGAMDFIVKPFQKDKILETITKISNKTV